MENSEVRLEKINVPSFDFNSLAGVIDSIDCESKVTNHTNTKYILESPFQLGKNVQKHPIFWPIWETFEKQYNQQRYMSDMVLFFSFCAGGRSNAHRDIEDVKIFGLYGKTIYIVEGKEYTVNRGDLLHIPRNALHRAIGITPRIVGSYGIFYGR
tara:strand:- start:896 stop:1360 length:465 start_codon:yes stop_codon:yes gene_type:complete